MNFFAKYDWETMLGAHPENFGNISKKAGLLNGELDERETIIRQYHEILCPKSDYPDFLDKYIELPLMQRLKGVGLLCGTDWTRLYRNRFYYSRLDHSKGVALIIWHFTHNKAQTLAGLFHDVATPVFSHVSDFRKGDALTQTATEAPTATMLRADEALGKLLASDGLTVTEVEDYHIYPIADNEIPQLSADRLEYMFPSGMALDGSWTMSDIRRCYGDITVLKGEGGVEELGFRTRETAELYCEHFCMIGHILQLNENKLTLQLLGQVMNLAEEEGILQERDFMELSEREVMTRLEEACGMGTAEIRSGSIINKREGKMSDRLYKLYKTFRTMTEIKHTESALPEDDWFCVNLKVKQRYINPLVISTGSGSAESADNRGIRLSEISEKAGRIIRDFLTYSDTPYGCVKLI